MQEGGTGVDDNAAASATFTEHSSLHHPADRDDGDASSQSVPEITSDEEQVTLEGKKAGSGSGYEVPDPRDVEEAHMRDQQPVEYTGIQTDTTEDLYSIPKKKKKP